MKPASASASRLARLHPPPHALALLLVLLSLLPVLVLTTMLMTPGTAQPGLWVGLGVVGL